jgi:hypothetical protein
MALFEDDIEIKLRPLGVPVTEPVIVPEPVAPPVQPAMPLETSIKATVEQDGQTQSELLLQAIICASRKATPNRANLVSVRFTREHALDF